MIRFVVLAMLAACSTPIGGAERAAPDQGSASTRDPELMLDDVAMLATGRRLPPEERTRLLAEIDAGSTTLEAQVTKLLADPGFAHVVAPRMMLGYLSAAPFSFELNPLKTTTIDGVTVHYRRQECKSLAETADVVPWWAMKSKIKICKADYRPEMLRDSKGRFCHGVSGNFLGTECGCGPNLMFCAGDPDHRQQVFASLRKESIRTIAYLVEHDQPLAEVFTTKSTFRDATAAWSHYRDQIMNGKMTEMPDLSSWPDEGKWAPRPEVWPGQHAGIMTNLHLAYFSDGPRDRMRFYYERAWCLAPTSFGVDVHQFQKLVHGAQDLRYHQARWKELAAAPGCTTCHARLDYGMQFFLGYQDFMTAMGPMLSKAKPTEEGPLYADDIEDPRGSGKLTPEAFGKLLVSQPEFDNCMVEHVNRHVFGGAASLEERDALLEEFKRTGTLRAMMARALVLYARDKRAVTPVTDTPARSAAASPTVSLSSDLVKLLGEHCSDCHDTGRHDFLAKLEATKTLPRDRVIQMLNLTAFDVMPRVPHRLSLPQRQVMVTEMIRGLALGDAGETNAKAYFLGEGFRGSRAHFIDASRNSIADAVGYQKHGLWPWGVESELEGTLTTITPGLVMQLSQTAMEACRAVEVSKREACLTRALAPELYLAP